MCAHLCAQRTLCRFDERLVIWFDAQRVNDATVWSVYPRASISNLHKTPKAAYVLYIRYLYIGQRWVIVTVRERDEEEEEEGEEG